jgi:hypothetical protein
MEIVAKRRYTAGMKLNRFLIFAVACLVTFAASAQWQWLDMDGRRVFSDRPPPIDIPEKNIVQKPSPRSQLSAVAPVAAGTPANAKPGDADRQGGTDKSLMEKKQQAEAAEAAKKKAEEEQNARIRGENCTRAQQAKAGLDAGGRMSRLNEKGEREFFDEGARAEEAARLQTIIDQNCR